MPLIIRDVLSCTWPLPMGSQESSRYGRLTSGVNGMDWLLKSWLLGLGVGGDPNPALCLLLLRL